MPRCPRTPLKTQTFSGAERECFEKKTTFFKEETTTNTISSKNLWKAIHHPSWKGVHPEPDAFFDMGKYYFAISKHTPKSLLSEIKIGDRIVVQPQTMIRKRGNEPLKHKRALPYLRYGTIISNPILETDPALIACTKRKTLYRFRVDWDDSFVPVSPKVKSNGRKTFTLIN